MTMQRKTWLLVVEEPVYVVYGALKAWLPVAVKKPKDHAREEPVRMSRHASHTHDIRLNVIVWVHPHRSTHSLTPFDSSYFLSVFVFFFTSTVLSLAIIWVAFFVLLG